MYLLNSYISAMPRLYGEQSMDAAQRVAVGSGTMDKSDRKKLVGHWQKLTGDNAVRKPSPEERRAMLESVGISIG